MTSLINIYITYLISFCHEVFTFPIRDIVLRDASNSLNNRITYRFPMRAPEDKLISIRIIKFILFNILKSPSFKLNNEKSGVAIFDVNSGGEKLRSNYVERLSSEKAQMFISRSELIKAPSFLSKLFELLHVLLVSPFIILISFFSKNKLKAPYHLLCSIEARNMYRALRSQFINKVHYFCIHETDSNLMAYVLMQNGIYINKIPSEVPLQFLNKTIVSDSLSFCFRYQEEEYMKYRATMHVKKIQHWIPEGSFNLEAFYNVEERSTRNKTIGFYSSGMWLRNEIDIMDLQNADLYEKELLEMLVNYIKENPDFQLIVFLHPIEKRNLEKTRAYYDKFLVPINFANTTVANSSLFKEADVVVSLYSTLAFERIFWGFKTIIYPMGQDEFPIKNSTFEVCCAKSPEELFSKLYSALSINTEMYFINSGLSEYRYKNYECFSKKAA